jgi:hypothetical protein
MRKVGDLKKTKNNPRKDADLVKLRENLEEYGDLGVIVFNVRLGELVTGNQRSDILQNAEIESKKLKEMRKDGTVGEGFIKWEGKAFAYREVSWDEEKHRRAVILANTHAGKWDKTELKKNWSDLDLSGFGILESKGKMKEDGEVVFSTELDEKSNYVVLRFDKDIDWLQFLSLVGLESTYSKRQNGKPWSKGVGSGPAVIN